MTHSTATNPRVFPSPRTTTLRNTCAVSLPLSVHRFPSLSPPLLPTPPSPSRPSLFPPPSPSSPSLLSSPSSPSSPSPSPGARTRAILDGRIRADATDRGEVPEAVRRAVPGVWVQRARHLHARVPVRVQPLQQHDRGAQLALPSDGPELDHGCVCTRRLSLPLPLTPEPYS